MRAFGQDQDFFYLSGVAEPELAMLLVPAGDGRDAVDELLVPPFSPFAAMWEGDYLAPGEKAEVRTGFATVGNSRQLRARLDALLQPDGGKRPVLWTRLSPAVPPGGTPNQSESALEAQRRDRFDGRGSREDALKEALLAAYPDLEIKDLTPLLHRQRAIKTASEIALLRASAELAAEGIAEAIKSTRPGLYEFQVAAVARYVFSLRGAGPDAYGAIVGAGKNGCVLHYMRNDARIEDGDLIVMDYAATLHGYAADVTRTFPANGRFTDDQRKLVQDVFEVQQALIADVKPGASLGALSRRCARLLHEKGYRSDHGPSHHVGLAVHDPSVDVLEPGMVLTVEPGAYLRKEGMGCRIEDTLLVTETGCVNLSARLPSSPEGIEALMRQPGVVDLPVGLVDPQPR
jgi:Xaa-Pro aminopeptidase